MPRRQKPILRNLSSSARNLNVNFKDITIDTLFSAERVPFLKSQTEVEHWVDTGQPSCLVYYDSDVSVIRRTCKCKFLPSYRKEGQKWMHDYCLNKKCDIDDCYSNGILTDQDQKIYCDNPCIIEDKFLERKEKFNKIFSTSSSSSESENYHKLKRLIPKVLRKSIESYDDFSRRNNRKVSSNTQLNSKKCEEESGDQCNILIQYSKNKTQGSKKYSQINSLCETNVSEIKKFKSILRKTNHQRKRKTSVQKNAADFPTNCELMLDRYGRSLRINKAEINYESSCSNKSLHDFKSVSPNNQIRKAEKFEHRNKSSVPSYHYTCGSESSVLTASYIKSIRSKMHTQTPRQISKRNQQSCVKNSLQWQLQKTENTCSQL